MNAFYLFCQNLIPSCKAGFQTNKTLDYEECCGSSITVAVPCLYKIKNIGKAHIFFSRLYKSS